MLTPWQLDIIVVTDYGQWKTTQKETVLSPDFVIELRSPTDSLEKLRLKMLDYQTNGCRLGWFIAPLTPLVEIYRLAQNIETINFSFEELPTLSGEDVLPRFSLDLIPILHP